MQITFNAKLPSAQRFKALRNSAGWGDITVAQSKATLSASLGGMCAYKGETLVGMTRYIGDGVLNLYLQDVIVHADYRKQGLGKTLIKRTVRVLQENYPADCTIGLMAAKGQDAFYMQFGFNTRPSDVYGAGMIAALGNLCTADDTGEL
ncbi:GNAT family N-acetyltransferase [Fretibacter rubidus]|uniref:GNAT family N-acetyltransferase n=1 Tax=Fretibacter rubidus TaxID=570162 RepID=UPI00352B0CC7